MVGKIFTLYFFLELEKQGVVSSVNGGCLNIRMKKAKDIFVLIGNSIVGEKLRRQSLTRMGTELSEKSYQGGDGVNTASSLQVEKADVSELTQKEGEASEPSTTFS